MRKSFLLYLWLFTALFALFVYVSGSRKIKAQEEEITALKEQIPEIPPTEHIEVQPSGTDAFSLAGNDQAMAYFEARGLDPQAVMQQVETAIISKNKASADNPLIPYEGMEGYFRINKIKLLNHKWVMASFTDGTYWGDVLITYDVHEGEIELQTEKAVLYPLEP